MFPSSVSLSTYFTYIYSVSTNHRDLVDGEPASRLNAYAAGELSGAYLRWYTYYLLFIIIVIVIVFAFVLVILVV